MGKNRDNDNTKIDEKESQMEFTLFKGKPFKINNPLTLIEAYCIQQDFYKNYDHLKNKTIEDVNQIGAQVRRPSILNEANGVVTRPEELKLLQLNIDELLEKPDNTKKEYIGDFSKAIEELIEVKGIELSTATKIYHTLHPEIIPMIDSLLQGEYMRVKGITRRQLSFDKLFIDYYETFKDNKKNIDKLYEQLSSQQLRLTKVRIFDIIWWSFLKYKRLAADFPEIRWSTIIESK